MNEKQQLYEAPLARAIVVNTESCILQNSIKASRDSYGAAQTDTWE